ncbi:hypothetical protein B0H13DRAFT_2676343 [Mycena leptocephala]|nr:hypothetical protein B0H13DRAFT_2676343 [Mycena leptocephala]
MASTYANPPVPHIICDSGAPITILGYPFGVPHRIEDDTNSDYPDSLPDLITDPGSDRTSSEASSALITRGPLDLCFPGTCDVNFAPNVVDRLLGGNRTVRALYQGTLGAASFQPPPPSYDDLVDTVEYGERRVRIREAITFRTCRVLDTVSAGGGAHIPSSIPDAALEELGLPMPTLSLLRSEHIGITYEMRSYASRDEALANLQLIYDICQHFTLWMAFAMLVSIQNGPDSTLNFGASIGMHTIDFMPRVRTCFPMGRFAPLAAYMADKQHANKMDFALVRLLNPECEHVLIGSHEGKSYITTWPVPAIKVPLLEAAPIAESSRDILSRGIRRRQLKSVQDLLAELML